MRICESRFATYKITVSKGQRPFKSNCWHVAGNVVGKNHKGQEMQEFLETIHTFWIFRLIITHKNRFLVYE